MTNAALCTKHTHVSSECHKQASRQTAFLYSCKSIPEQDRPAGRGIVPLTNAQMYDCMTALTATRRLCTNALPNHRQRVTLSFVEATIINRKDEKLLCHRCTVPFLLCCQRTSLEMFILQPSLSR